MCLFVQYYTHLCVYLYQLKVQDYFYISCLYIINHTNLSGKKTKIKYVKTCHMFY